MLLVFFGYSQLVVSTTAAAGKFNFCRPSRNRHDVARRVTVVTSTVARDHFKSLSNCKREPTAAVETLSFIKSNR